MSKENCILVGRCGNVILKEAGVDVFSIFLYADLDVRVERAKNIIDKKNIDIKKFVEKCDARRKNYYKAYTHHLMDCAQDYNICLDTGAIGYDKCISLLADLIKDKYLSE